MADWTYESTVALEPSSTLEYLNSQLVSQGYVPPPGLQLQVLQGKDQERAIRCILSLLSQRVDDLRRFENANAKYKTQTFELDRYRTMWREECEKSANAEREMTLFKSKLTGSQKQVEELQKKCQATLVDLSRTKSTLLSVRNGAAMEVKRKEKEVERLLERFQKVAGSATLRVTGQSTVEEAAHSRVLKSDKGLVEEALELAEAELDDLKGERERLHDVFIWTARELSALVADGTEVDPKSCIANPTETFTPLLGALRLRLLAKKPDDAEYTRLQGIIAGLRGEVDNKEKLLKKFEDHFAALKERCTVDVSGNEELSRERTRLDIYRLELEEERKRIASADLELQEIRTALETDRLNLAEEQSALEERRRKMSEKPATQSISPHFLAPPSEPQFDLAPIASSSSPPRKRKPRDFPVGVGHSPTKSPKRRKAVPAAVPQILAQAPQSITFGSESLDDCEEQLAATPILITTPPFSPLPSPPGALSLNGIGLEVINELTPIQPRRRFPKHAFSPARPSPLCQPMKMSMSDTSFNSEQGTEELEAAAAQLEKEQPITSSFPAMPVGLAKKLGVIDSNRGLPELKPAPEPSLGDKGKGKAKPSLTTDPIQQSKHSRPSEESLASENATKTEKENRKTQSTAGVKKASTSGGARRVPVPSKGSWR